MQQLDLFGGFDAPPPAKEVKQKAAPKEVTIIAEEPPQPAIAAPAKITPPLPEPLPAVTEQPVVFSDDKIAVKIKPRISVQMPAPANESRQVIVTRQAVAEPKPAPTAAPASVVATVVKPKSKRGRKSYKEIDAELDLVEVPEEEVLNQKMYYSITEVARWFKVNASLLRYWENEFDILKPRKNRKGDRLFRPEDIRNLQVIYYLLRNRKFSIEGAKKYLRNHRQQADINVQLAQSLTKFRSFLLELKANLGA